MERTYTVEDPLAFKNELVNYLDDNDVAEISNANVEAHAVTITSPDQLSIDEEEVALLVAPTGLSLPINVGDEVTVRVEEA